MSGLWQRIEDRAGVLVVRSRGIPLAAIRERLDEGTGPAAIATELAIEAPDLAASFAHIALGEDDSLGLPLNTTRSDTPRRHVALTEQSWSSLLPHVARPARLALAAALLQVFDHWEPSHEAAQQAGDLGESAVSAYWHGIAHRREPDSANASYWFRRVGPHPVFKPLAKSVEPLLEDYPDLSRKLIKGGAWDPFAFINFCADGRPSATVANLARRFQRLEMICLLDATARSIGLA